MKQGSFAIGVLLAMCVAIVTFSSIYVLDVTQQVFITRFGKVVGEPITQPGLKFKVPIVDKINRFDKRYLEWDGHRNQVTTGDQRFIEIDTYARWRILDARTFFEKVKDESGARTRLDDILDGAARSAIAEQHLAEIVRSKERKNIEPEKALQPQPATEDPDDPEGSGQGTNVLQPFKVGRETLSRQILEKAKVSLAEFGIELLDFRFKRINYAPEDQDTIFKRMIAVQEEKMTLLLGEGEGEVKKIKGDQQLDKETILSEADRMAMEIRGEADAEAARIYTEAYNQSPEAREFYEFYKTMEAYKESIGQKDWLIFSSQSEFFRYLKHSK